MIDDVYLYNSVEVAAFIVAKANENKLGINMTKLQKLLYIAYGTSLVIYGERLTNEHPQAWPFGPVFPTTRNRLIKLDFDSINMDDPTIKNIKEEEKLKKLIDFVFEGFGKWTAKDLTAWSHKESSPWWTTKAMKDFKWGNHISDENIYNYFNAIIKKNGQ